MTKVRYTLIILLIISGILAGCVDNPGERLLSKNTIETTTVKFIENQDPLLTKSDFPDFELIDHTYFITPENLSLTLETEAFHGAGIINASEGIPKGYRLYGSAETYKSIDRYIIVQYKAFDNSENLNDSMNETVFDYINAGFKPKRLNAAVSDKRIFVLESNVTNKSANRSDMNVTVILFGYDNVLGKIGVQDSKDKSLNESLMILNIVPDRIKIRSKEVIAEKKSMFDSGMGITNQSKQNSSV